MIDPFDKSETNGNPGLLVWIRSGVNPGDQIVQLGQCACRIPALTFWVLPYMIGPLHLHWFNALQRHNMGVCHWCRSVGTPIAIPVSLQLWCILFLFGRKTAAQ